MKKTLLFLLAFSGVATAQRYTSEIFTQVNVNADVPYAVNFDFMPPANYTSNPARVAAEVTEVKTAVALGNPIPAKYFNPADTSAQIKVRELTMDVYTPDGDTEINRPLAIYLHTGNFLPPGINGGINGTKNDSAAIVMCRKLARRGFVAVAANYRWGWNPLATSQAERRAQLLNAVYRAIHDTKELVRVLKADASNLGIDPNKLVLFGEGSGGYVALAYTTLDKWAEVTIPKFINPQTNSSYIDTNLVGNFDALGGLLNLYSDNGQSTDIAMCINMGGALADLSWLEAGDAPMISFHAVRDPFAPFDEGTVVVPTTQDDVVDVVGANVFMERANQLGNNSSFTSQTFNDPITLAARSRYGQTYNYIYPAPFDTISVNSNVEGLFPVLQPLTTSGNLFLNVGAPWQWWDPNGPIASQVADPTTGVTFHQQGLAGNPNMSPQFGRTYQDTILNYATPRMMFSLNLISNEEFAFNEAVSMYPNPAQHMLYLESTSQDLELDQFEITDQSGRVVRAGDLSVGRNDISLEGLAPGIYFVRVESNKGSAVERFVKQ